MAVPMCFSFIRIFQHYHNFKLNILLLIFNMKMNLGLSLSIGKAILKKYIGRRHISAVQNEYLEKLYPEERVPRTDAEWLNAKDFSSLPGPSKLELIMKFLPWGDLYKSDSYEMYRTLCAQYGDIFLLKGIGGNSDYVVISNPYDIETVFRNESLWPVRSALKSFEYYRQQKRPDIFQGNGGLLSEQGERWADFRNKVNPILMKPQNVRANLSKVDEIARDLVTRLDCLIDPATGLLRNYFIEEVQAWSFETMTSIVFNRRMNSMVDNPDPRVRLLYENMGYFFKYSYHYDVKPSYWKYFETPGFKKLMKAHDVLTDTAIEYVDDAIRIFEREKHVEPQSMLEKLYRIDKHVATVMAMDLLMGGVETTSTASIIVLYYLSKNLDKQNILYEELCQILPTLDSPLTEENSSRAPYLKACIKEALRFVTIASSNLRLTGKDIVLSGYRIPKGIQVVMNGIALANSEKYFSRSKEYIPERWLKNSQYYDKDTNPFVSLPFGFGPRACIGKRFANMEIETLITRLLRKYEIRWAEKEDMKFIYTISTTPKVDSKFQLVMR